MRKLDIQITKAKLLSFDVSFDEDKEQINVSATIGLMTETGKKITNYTVNSNSWRDEDKFVVPISMIAPIQTIAKELERIVTLHCRQGQLALVGTTEEE